MPTTSWSYELSRLNQTLVEAVANSSQVENLVSQMEVIVSKPTVSKEVGRIVLKDIDALLNVSAEALSSSTNR